MERKTVVSSLLRSVGYDAATETLEVEFARNPTYIYQYHDVPMTVALQMSQAESMGRFYLQEIKTKFKCTRIEAKDEPKPKEEEPAEEQYHHPEEEHEQE